jgi:threonine dehydrogenase-like Zn-dependent dehydrogenase
MQQVIAIHYGKIYKSNKLSLHQLALVEPLSVGYHAAERAGVSGSDTVLVIGCGVIGIGVIVACIRKGARVIAADISDEKLLFIRQFGVQHVINTASQDILSMVNELTDSKGVHVAFEAVGSAPTYQWCLQAVSYAGRIAAIGYAREDILLNTSLIVRKELNIVGCRNALNEFGPVIHMLEEGLLPFDELISKTYSIQQAGEAFDYWYHNPTQVIKILININ